VTVAVDQSVADRIARRGGRSKAPPGTRAWVRRDYGKLTERERAVLILKLSGAKHREIAQKVRCHEKHVSRIVHLPRFQNAYERMHAEFGAMFLALGPQALRALENGLASEDNALALRAAEMWFDRLDRLRRDRNQAPSAEDTASQLLREGRSAGVE
jgi:Homeodomain-like domain